MTSNSEQFDFPIQRQLRQLTDQIDRFTEGLTELRFLMQEQTENARQQTESIREMREEFRNSREEFKNSREEMREIREELREVKETTKQQAAVAQQQAESITQLIALYGQNRSAAQ